jgi:hypothetical protein
MLLYLLTPLQLQEERMEERGGVKEGERLMRRDAVRTKSCLTAGGMI